MSSFNLLILLAIIAITSPIAPTQAADIDVGPLSSAAEPHAAGCKADKVIINDDLTITLENFNFNGAQWGLVVAWNKDPYNGQWPIDGKPISSVRPFDAVFVLEDTPEDGAKCQSMTYGPPVGFPKTIKVKAADGKRLLKDSTKFIGVYCMHFDDLFCRVDVSGKLDAMTISTSTATKKCSAKFTNCWYKGGGQGYCGDVDLGSNGVASTALPSSIGKGTPLLGGGLVVVVMLAFPGLMK